MEITKYKSYQIMPLIRHILRQLPEGKTYGNESVDLSLSHENYSLIDRGSTAIEVNQYRKDFENKIFKYNRKDIVHAVNLAIQCPDDCPPEQQDAFFKIAFNWYCNTYLPAGKECVFLAEVHKDEHKFITTLQNGKEIKKDISKAHLHIAYVPAIPAGENHPDYTYRLNAYELTTRAILKDMHPSLQQALDAAGIKATVFRKKNNDGKSISLSIKQLKALTEKTGLVIDHSLTLDELARILVQNVELTRANKELTNLTSDKDKELSTLHNELKKRTDEINRSNQNFKLELQQKEQYLSELTKQKEQLQDIINSKDLELQAKEEKIERLESRQVASIPANQDPSWGSNANWGTSSGWGNKNIDIEEENLW